MSRSTNPALSKLFSVLPCQDCGKCCRHGLKHCGAGEAGGVDVGETMWVIDSLEDGTCKQLEEFAGEVKCRVYENDNYPITCQIYPFQMDLNNPHLNQLYVSATCTHVSKVIEEFMANPEYRSMVGPAAEEIKALMRKKWDYQDHFDNLIANNKLLIQLKP